MPPRKRPPKRPARTTAPRPTRADDAAGARGTLIIVGGHEDKTDERLILTALARRVNGGRLVVATVASQEPDALWRDYEAVFGDLGVRHVVHLDVQSRQEAQEPDRLRLLDSADAVFFTGGDQLKITSQLGDSPLYERIRQIYLEGGTVAGTSAGASVMAETMLVSGESDASPRIGTGVRMAPGLGLFPGAIIDQHFAERGRVGRLVGAVAQNPRILGVGIDEDTAIVLEPGGCFSVLGRGAVYVLDGARVTYSNLTEEETDRALSTFDVRLHMLTMGDAFDLATRTPANRPAEEAERELVDEAKPARRPKRAPRRKPAATRG
ncbi:cyanophycinase [Roseisolibacter sp. H3M3-2]|uniref:cyanophycinase n=1 Tax=Roseisolibacter sp. H3M3-2 TaxID=3031323 RepID=UPI0023DC6AB0|nr:cyanophycinase [Roseisolibacter sp. H3M3-2]MDF1503595.1 cyanophycinase [Roseisolibacter sp. H3M3-2]